MDSAAKIAACMQAAAKAAELPIPSTNEAKSIIGLGLMEAAAMLFPKASDNQHQALVEAYRYQFLTADKTDQQLFDGVEQGLVKLEQAGAILAVATGKSRVGLDRALTATGLAKYFTVTRCADETRSKPHPQMLHEILEFTAIEANKAIMVGDTSFDLDMAQHAKMAGLGAGYGVHSRETLLNSGALSVQTSYSQLIDWLLDGRIEAFQS